MVSNYDHLLGFLLIAENASISLMTNPRRRKKNRWGRTEIQCKSSQKAFKINLFNALRNAKRDADI